MKLNMEILPTWRLIEMARDGIDSFAGDGSTERQALDELASRAAFAEAEVERLRAQLERIANYNGDRWTDLHDLVAIARRALEGSDGVRLGDENPLRRALDVPRVTEAERAEALRVREVIAEDNSPR